MAKNRSGFITSAGVLTIVGSCLALVIGLLGLVVSGYAYEYDTASYAVMGIFGILAFAFGLTAGILTLKRKVFPLAIIGICFVIVSGIVISIAIPYGAFWIFGVPIAILSILGVIFAAISKREFT